MSLTTLADFHALALDKKHEVYETVSDHLHGKTSLMPPPPNAQLSSEELKTFGTWLADGAHAVATGDACSSSEVDAGTAPVYSVSSDPPADCEDFYEFHAHDKSDPKDQSAYQLAASQPGENSYLCIYFDPPYAKDASTLWIESLVDNSKVVHHWILYGSDNLTKPAGTVEPCGAAIANAFFIAGWAPGGGNFALPDDVELDLPRGDKAGLVLQIHYYNPDGKAAKDKTGLRMCTAKSGTRKHEAGVTYTGSEGICLHPGDKKVVSGTCDPRDDMGDIHIIGVSPHMHKLGRRMKITVQRANGKQETLHDEPFDFTSQTYYPLPPEKWILHPGDRLQTDCYYENDGTSAVHFGERTQDEMCYGFVTSWPAGALANANDNVVQNVSNIFEPKRRCMDPLGFLASCNGAADVSNLISQ
jgi:hypothetical protein